MDNAMLEQRLENLDRGLARVEQILPTLATKAEIKAAIAPLATKAELQAAIAPLATKEELRAAIAPLATTEELRLAIAEGIAPLATREELKSLGTELRQEIREEGERSRRYMDVVTESLRGDIHLIAEHVASAVSKRTEG